MHRALLVHDILHSIFLHLHYHSSVLAALARTCRSFKGTALNALWADLPDLSPLIRCLPTNAWGVLDSHDSMPELIYTITRPLKDTEWNIIRDYARRIRRLACGQELDETTIRILCHPPTPDPLFPNLQILEWSDERRDTFPFIHRIVGPQTACIQLTFTWDEDWGLGELAVLTSLPSICPALTEISMPRMGEGDNNTKDTSHVSEILSRWVNLETASCDLINRDVFLHLGTIQTLHHLSFYLHPSTLDGLPDDLTGTFSSLESMRIASNNIIAIEQLMRKLHISPHELNLVCFDSATQWEAHSYCAALKESCHHRRLERLLISYRGEFTHCLVIQSLTPLTSFSNLARLVIDTGGHVSLSGEDLLDLTSAWPCMTHLSLNESTGWVTRSGATPNFLAQLPIQCKRLTYLAINIHSDTFEHVIPGDPPIHTSLTSLVFNVLDSPIRNSAVVPLATFLARVYPNVALTGRGMMEGQGEIVRLWVQLWDRVKQQIEKLRRTHERET